MRLTKYALAAALCVSGASGMSLRDNLALQLQGKMTTPSDCAPKSPSKEQRTCENTNLNSISGRPQNMPPANCKECFTECSCAGDPHCATFYSKCTTVVGTREGEYLLYEVPKNGKQNKMSFTMTVYAPSGAKKKGSKYIKTIKLNDKVILDADDCWQQGKAQKVEGSINMYSDSVANQKNANSDIKLWYMVECRDKAETMRRAGNAPQLMYNVRLKDPFDTHAEQPPKKMPPDTTFYFKNDKGICVDPVVHGKTEKDTQKGKDPYDLNCNRQYEGWKYTSARYCNCSYSCAAWGDPHLMSFYTDQCRKSKGCNFKVPVNAPAQYNIQYSAAQTIASSTTLDPRCNMIQEVEVQGMTQRMKQKWYQCNPKNNLDDPLQGLQSGGFLKDSSWDKVRLRADLLCKKLGFSVVLPQDPSKDLGIVCNQKNNNDKRDCEKLMKDIQNFNKDNYDANYGGYNLGEFALVQRKGAPSDSDFHLVPLAEGAGYSSCIDARGYNVSTATNRVHFGGMYTTAVCHQTKGGLWYFNMCVNKKSVTVQKFYRNGKELQTLAQEPLIAPNWGNAMAKTLERAARTMGFCATGDFKKNTGSSVSSAVNSATFEYRSAGTTVAFYGIDNGGNPSS